MSENLRGTEGTCNAGMCLYLLWVIILRCRARLLHGVPLDLLGHAALTIDKRSCLFEGEPEEAPGLHDEDIEINREQDTIDGLCVQLLRLSFHATIKESLRNTAV